MLPTDAKERKNLPIFSGFVKYFPRAMAAVAGVSKHGNDQHNPGEPLHWSRGKSNDHHDCAMRHLMQAGTADDDGQLHSAKAAWRMMAILELELEAVFPATSGRIEDMAGIPDWTVSYTTNVKVVGLETGAPKCYLAGKMTGIPFLNFPAFDEGKEMLEAIGYDVISPADLDRAAGVNEYHYENPNEVPSLSPEAKRDILRRDIEAILSLNPKKDAIALMDGWEDSIGACAEFFCARWHGLRMIDVHGITLHPADVDFIKVASGMFRYMQKRMAS